MRNLAIIPGSKERFLINRRLNINENTKISLVNICMKLGLFNIKINITRGIKKSNNRIVKNIEHSKRINEILETRNNLEINYNLMNYLK